MKLKNKCFFKLKINHIFSKKFSENAPDCS